MVAVAGALGLLPEEVRHRGMDPRDRALVPAHVVPERARAKAGDNRDGPAVSEHRVDRDVRAAVEHRRADEEPVVAADTDLVEARLAHLQVEHIRPADCLRDSCCPAGEHHHLVVPRLDRLGEDRRRLVVVRRHVVERERGREPVRQARRIADDDDPLEVRQVETDEPVDEPRVCDEHAGVHEVERVREQGALVRRVERRVHEPRRGCAEPREQRLLAVRKPRDDRVALLEPERPQSVRAPPGARRRLGVRPRVAVLEDGEDLVGTPLGVRSEQLRQHAFLPCGERRHGV